MVMSHGRSIRLPSANLSRYAGVSQAEPAGEILSRALAVKGEPMRAPEERERLARAQQPGLGCGAL